MTKMDVALAFFHACEGLEGREGCSQYVADGAIFEAQSEPIADISVLLDYCDWMAGLGSTTLKGCGYKINSASFDDGNNTALIFGTFTGKHVGEGGPIPPTNKETQSHYVYAITVNKNQKISRMVKIWNAPWALGELGWA
jgi:hypothetical protein